MNPAPDELMPRLICVTPEEAQAAQVVAGHLRSTWRICPQPQPGAPSNAGSLAAHISLPLGDLYHLLTWLDHMAAG